MDQYYQVQFLEFATVQPKQGGILTNNINYSVEDFSNLILKIEKRFKMPYITNVEEVLINEYGFKRIPAVSYCIEEKWI